MVYFSSSYPRLLAVLHDTRQPPKPVGWASSDLSDLQSPSRFESLDVIGAEQHVYRKFGYF